MKFALVGATLGVLVVSGAALAQQPETPPRPETKTVEDWIVRCFPIQSPSPCDMFQEQDAQQTRQRVLSISIAFVPSLDRHALQVSVPLDISIGHQRERPSGGRETDRGRAEAVQAALVATYAAAFMDHDRRSKSKNQRQPPANADQPQTEARQE